MNKKNWYLFLNNQSVKDFEKQINFGFEKSIDSEADYEKFQLKTQNIY